MCSEIKDVGRLKKGWNFCGSESREVDKGKGIYLHPEVLSASGLSKFARQE